MEHGLAEDLGTGESVGALVERIARQPASGRKFSPVKCIRWAIGRRYAYFRRTIFGAGAVNMLQHTILEHCARVWWLLRSIDEYVAQHSLEQGYSRDLTSLLKERSSLAARLERDLTLLSKARGILASTPTASAPRVTSPSTKAKSKGSGKAKDPAEPVGTP